jgi:general secretion pathway protein A
MIPLVEPDVPSHPYVEQLAFVAPPFLQSADPRFVCRTESHARAVDVVTSAVEARQPLVVVCGNEGAGKTTLCLALQQHFGPRTFMAALLNRCESADDVIGALLRQFGIVTTESERRAAADSTPDDRYLALNSFLVSLTPLNCHAVVIVDEAHRLPGTAWDAILRLTNFAFNHPGLLQIVLVGGPELDERLRAFPNLADRVPWRHTLTPLGSREVATYIARRLWIARGGLSARSSVVDPLARAAEAAGRAPRLTRAAQMVIAQRSSGNPRLVNAICDAAIAAACERGRQRIGWWSARRAAGALGLAGPSRWGWLPTRKMAMGVALAIGAVASLTTTIRNGTRIQATTTTAGVVQSISAASDIAFDTLRDDALRHANSLATQPDVRALLKLQSDVQVWDSKTNFSNHSRVAALMVELERLTDAARRRQLDRDRELLLKAQ